MPSLTDRSLPADKVTVGATLATVTVWVAVLLLALSESLTCTDTMLERRTVSEDADETARPRRSLTCPRRPGLPLAPQRWRANTNVSVTGVGDREAVGVLRGALVDRQVVAGRQGDGRGDIGDRHDHDLVVGVEAPSESVTVAVTLRRRRPISEEALETASTGADVVLSDPATLAPLAPQRRRDRVGVQPGSVTVKL